MSREFPRIGSPTTCAGIALACCIVALAGFAAVHISKEYYRVAAYHYDSASHRMLAFHFYDLLQHQGLASTLGTAMQNKDSLDITLRLLFWPEQLTNPYGHMVVLLPFMALFVSLVMYYMFLRSNSHIFSIAIAILVVSFPLLYGPIQGIADYWKDNIGNWILGSAAVGWMLSDSWSRKRWLFLSGLLLGLLSMQRSALAVYAACLFLPLLIYNFYRTARDKGASEAFTLTLIFLLPALLLTAAVALMQFHKLFRYYFVQEYDVGTMAQTARFLIKRFSQNTQANSAPTLSYSAAVLGGLYLLNMGSPVKFTWRDPDFITATWLVLGFPVIIIAWAMFYHSFYMVWIVFLIILLSVSLPLRRLSSHGNRIAGLVLISFAFVSAIFNYNQTLSNARVKAAGTPALQRQLYDKMTDIIMAQPEPHYVSFLFDEIKAPFYNHVVFNRGISDTLPHGIVHVGFMSVHDNYYRAPYGDMSVEQIVPLVTADLEKYSGTIAFLYCDPADISRDGVFRSTGQRVAMPIAIAMHTHIMSSSRWKLTATLSSPYGCLLRAYRYYSANTP